MSTSPQPYQRGQILRYTDDGDTFDAMVIQQLPDGSYQIEYQRPGQWRRFFATVPAESLSLVQ